MSITNNKKVLIATIAIVAAFAFTMSSVLISQSASAYWGWHDHQKWWGSSAWHDLMGEFGDWTYGIWGPGVW